MYNIYKIILATMAFILFNNADCSHKKPDCYISDEFKSYVIFGKDSFWVYQNNLGVLDTVEVVEVRRTITGGVGSPFSNLEEFIIKCKSTLHGDIDYFAPCASAEIIGFGNCDDNPTLLQVYNQDYNIILDLFYCCCDPNPTSNTSTKYLGIDSTIVNGVVYNNLMKFKYDSLYPGSSKIHYYKQNTGLVKYERYNGETWELIDYKIEN